MAEGSLHVPRARSTQLDLVLFLPAFSLFCSPGLSAEAIGGYCMLIFSVLLCLFFL